MICPVELLALKPLAAILERACQEAGSSNNPPKVEMLYCTYPPPSEEEAEYAAKNKRTRTVE